MGLMNLLTCDVARLKCLINFIKNIHTKKLRLLKGEYYYHRIQARRFFESFAWIEDEPILPNDVVVLSVPIYGQCSRTLRRDNGKMLSF